MAIQNAIMVGVTQRRRVLVLVAIVLIVLNSLFIALRHSERPTRWVVRDPSLESYQLAHPYDVLFGSDAWDERLPPSSVLGPFNEHRPSIVRDLLACGAANVMVEEHTGPPQMPTRFYLTATGNGSSLRDCVRRKLPAGYVIEHSGSTHNEAMRSVRFPPTVDINASASLSGR